MATRPAVPKRAPAPKPDPYGMDQIAAPFRQISKDVVQGTRSLIDQGKAAGNRIVEGYRKIKRSLTK